VAQPRSGGGLSTPGVCSKVSTPIMFIKAFSTKLDLKKPGALGRQCEARSKIICSQSYTRLSLIL
jgi:hypothetical protein